ncbi:F-box/FBD/LRR-repeat protein At1g78750-like [Rutidosis leptorrhynchoides]|uniref:F-box/FBD/LRR-repeat protein At1g78750-like n=1 Tax=Rutidosis leptorrhynchoides TaxID=125765 RepID=UPI003A99F03B
MTKTSSAANSCHEIMKKQQKGIDMISQLPDELLIRILYLLPAADVTRSRILSNRWKHLWAFLPNLHFVMPPFKEQVNKFNDSVDQILALRSGLPFKSFFFNTLMVAMIIVLIIGLVLFLGIKVSADDTYDVKFNWDLSITFNTLTKLTLKGVVLVAPIDEIPFPCLKILNLQCTEHFDTRSLMNLISRCPVLEELCLDWPGLTDKSGVVKLCSRSMRRLTLMRSEFNDEELVIDAPKLEYFHFFACYFRKYTLMSPTSLVEAYISNKRNHNIIQLLSCVSFTKILTLTSQSLWDYGTTLGINLPMFPNLVELEIPWELLPSITEWNLQMEQPPACLRFKLKEIFLVSYVKPEEIAIISYLMKHANNLEKLTIGNVDPDRREPWLNIHRATKSCRIEFV